MWQIPITEKQLENSTANISVSVFKCHVPTSQEWKKVRIKTVKLLKLSFLEFLVKKESSIDVENALSSRISNIISSGSFLKITNFSFATA